MKALKAIGCMVTSMFLAEVQAQCYGTQLFPGVTVVPNPTGTPTLISPFSNTGQYARLSLSAGHSYRFTSSVSSDHITISTAPGSGALAWGIQPLRFNAPNTGLYFVHFHTNPGCGTDMFPIPRTTQVQRIHCLATTSLCGGVRGAIMSVNAGSINITSSGCGSSGYTDFTTHSSGILAGASLPISVVNSTAGSGFQVRVFVDWDRNFSFDDPGETFILSTTDLVTYTGTITAPLSATSGPVRMRVRLAFTGAVPSCGNTIQGEVEDYTLVVTGSAVFPFLGGDGRGDDQLTIAGPGQLRFRGGDGRGDDQHSIAGPGHLRFSGGDGRGDDQHTIAGPGQLRFSGGDGRGDDQHAITGPGLLRFMGGDGRGDVMLAFNVQLPAQVFLALRGVLEGPYNGGTGLMGDALRTLPSFPLTEPYTALDYIHVGGGGETITPAVLATTGPDAIVDWVVVELRDALDPITVVATRSALLQRDGDVVATDGLSPLAFDLPAGSYHVVLLHRNHLGVMTQNPVAMDLSVAVLDIASASTPTFGTGARKSISGTFPVQALWAGDVNFDGVVRYTGANNDRDPILSVIGGTVPTATLDGYYPQDVNMDGAVKYTGTNNDRDVILQAVGGTVPTNTRVGQVP